MAGQQCAAVLDSRLAFYQRFEQIANHSGDGEPEQDREDPRRPQLRPAGPERQAGRAAQACPGKRVERDRCQRSGDAFPGLSRADSRGELALTKTPADEIRSRVGNPDRCQDGDQEGRTDAPQINRSGKGRHQRDGARCEQQGPAIHLRASPHPQRNEDDPEKRGRAVNPDRHVRAIGPGNLEDLRQDEKPDHECRVNRATGRGEPRQCAPFPGGDAEKQSAECDPAVPGQQEQRRQKHRQQDRGRQHAGFQHDGPRLPPRESRKPYAILRRPFESRLAFSSCSLVRPKRRSRSRYQAIAASSCPASKSGHSVGVK